MTPTAGDPYERFLASADAASWLDSLKSIAALVQQHGDSDEGNERLAQGLTVAAYVIWLGGISGDIESKEAGRQSHDELRAELERRSGGVTSPRLLRCWGIELLWSDFDRYGQSLLEADGPLPPELLLLALPADDVRQVNLLRPLFTRRDPCTFLPAVHRYGIALVGAGALHEARDVVLFAGWGPDHPMAAEVLAHTDERLGQWSDALDAYRRSPWPVHRYRAAMMGTIASRRVQASDVLELDQATRQLLNEAGDELSQVELTRSVGFLNACLWNPVDDWLVERELGTLCFRRRRFAEAEFHVARSLRFAPPRAMFPLAQFRFVNLTWLASGRGSGEDVGCLLDMTPETIVAGYQAINCAEPSDDTADIRTWLASETGDLSLIPASVDEWSPYSRADAFRAVAEKSREVDAGLETLDQEYNHRVIGELIGAFTEAGLRATATHLAEVVLRESEDRFSSLWETAEAVAIALVEAPQDTARGPTLVDRYGERLRGLSVLDFKNAIRAHAFFRRAGRSDLAEEMLAEATRLAESFSELLAVAVLRRSAGRVRFGRIDQEGLAAVMRAMPEARDRIDRLEVARELFSYGRVREGRALLDAEDVLARKRSLSPIEYVAVLRCGPWLSSGERRDLALAAASDLNFACEAGTLGDHPQTFGHRLIDVIVLIDYGLAEVVEEALVPALTSESPSVKWPGAHEADWSSFDTRIDDALRETELVTLTAIVEELSRSSSFGLRLMLVQRLRNALELLVEEARSIRPMVTPDDLPIARYAPGYDGPRTIDLCDLWRARLSNPGSAEDAAALQAFWAVETGLDVRWQERRRVESAETWRRVVGLLDLLQTALERLLAGDENSGNPVMAELFAFVATDVDRLLDEITRRRRDADAELAPVTPAGASGDST